MYQPQERANSYILLIQFYEAVGAHSRYVHDMSKLLMKILSEKTS